MFHGVGFDIHQRFEEKNLREGLDSILGDVAKQSNQGAIGGLA